MFEDPAVDASSDQPAILQFDRSLTHQTRSRERVPKDEETLGQYIPLLYHYNMLQDEDRVGAFSAAIDLLVQPRMSVVELGSGTGILSSLAVRRGAHVVAVERNPELISCSRKFIAANGLGDQINVVCDDASSWLPRQRVDVVICEMLHVGLLREKQAAVIRSFKANYLKKFGGPLPVFIPEVSILMFQPVQQCFEFAGYHAPVPMFQAPLQNQPRTRELAALQAYETITYQEHIPQKFDVRVRFQASDAGQLNAIRLVTQNVLAVDVPNQRAVTWPNQCLVLPIERPFVVRKDLAIELGLRYQAGGAVESVVYDVCPSTSQFHENVG